MVKERKHYQSKLESVVAERAQTLGLCRDFEEYAEFVGYLHIVSDDGEKELYEITLRGESGQIANVITKSPNVIKQIDDIMEVIGDEPRDRWMIGFNERKTNKGNTYIEVTMTTTTAGREPVPAPAADTEE